jgi:hypothetical protein
VTGVPYCGATRKRAPWVVALLHDLTSGHVQAASCTHLWLVLQLWTYHAACMLLDGALPMLCNSWGGGGGG